MGLPEGIRSETEKAFLARADKDSAPKPKLLSRISTRKFKIRAAIGGVLLGLGVATSVMAMRLRTPDETTEAAEKEDLLRKKLAAEFGETSADFAVKTVGNGQRIQKSKYKALELLRLQEEIQQKYPKIRPLRLFGYCDEAREAEQIATLHSARKNILDSKTKYRHYLPVSFIISALAAEGHSLDLDHLDSENPDGFANFGNDTFGSEFEKIAAAGFISPDFKNQFTAAPKTNEKGQQVTSAVFKNKKAAFMAFVAMLGYNQHLFYEDLRDKNIPIESLSGDERLFFTYFYYNAGPNSLDKTLKTEADVHGFFNEMKNVGARANAYRVMTGAKWLDASGALNQNPEGKYWWSKKTSKKESSGVDVGELEVESYEFDEARVTEPWLWLLKTARAEGWKGELDGPSKGLRSYSQQKKLYELFKSGKGAPAFNPDGKNAENARHLAAVVKKNGLWSMAVDVSDPETLIAIAAKHGVKLRRPYAKKEPWHIEAAGPFTQPEDWEP